MHQACFLLGTLWFSVLQWKWTNTLLRMGRIQGKKVSISQRWWFCYKASSSENGREPQLPVVFLWNGSFGHQDIQSHSRFHTYIWFLCITGQWFPFLAASPTHSISLSYDIWTCCTALLGYTLLAGLASFPGWFPSRHCICCILSNTEVLLSTLSEYFSPTLTYPDM